MESIKKKRVSTFDIMKFFGIVVVIIGHMTEHFREFIFSFHMPLFFILAGYFYHKREIVESLRLDVKHLVYPYLLTAIAIFLTYTLYFTINDDVDLKYWFIAMCYGSGSVQHTSYYLADMPAIGAIWFLLALFWCKNIFNAIVHFAKHRYIASLIISIVAICIDNYIINLPMTILPGMGAVMFYAMGHYIRQTTGFWKINPFIATVFILLWIISFLRYGLIGMVICSYPNFIINFLGAIGGTYALFLISDVLSTAKYPLHKVVIWGGAKIA